MPFPEIFADYSLLTIVIFAVVYFVAGFIDAVVGGGGLLTIPTLLVSLPNQPLPTLFGTNKIAAISGGTVAAYQYSKKVKFDFRLLSTIIVFASAASFVGAKTVSYLDSGVLKPLILVILVLIACYTFLKKDLGSLVTKEHSITQKIFFGSIIGIFVGFYDGFFGPGTGSFFVLGFVVILGFDFLSASAYSKIINCCTNFSALIVFIKQGNYILELALIMAIFNILGNFIGSKIALKKGNEFVRKIFLIILVFMIIRFGYDVFYK